MGETLLLSSLSKLAEGINPGKFAENLALFSIAWFVVKGTITKHFKSIEEKLENLTTTLLQVEKSHAEKIYKLERDMLFVKNKLNERGGSNV